MFSLKSQSHFPGETRTTVNLLSNALAKHRLQRREFRNENIYTHEVVNSFSSLSPHQLVYRVMTGQNSTKSLWDLLKCSQVPSQILRTFHQNCSKFKWQPWLSKNALQIPFLLNTDHTHAYTQLGQCLEKGGWPKQMRNSIQIKL